MKALIAMSGGVDSSVAALLTKEAGFECIGCTMKLYDNEDAGISRGHTCCSLDDVEDARSVAFSLDMPYYVFNFRDDFKEKIIDKFVDSYIHGITPNPCIDCNRYMKFDRLYERARVLGCDYIVTGHYARIEEHGGRFVLLKAADPSKDQSYVLYQLTQEQLAHTMFPLGGMDKTETRRIADSHGFVNADKPDSQDICFVPDGDYARVVEMYTHAGSEPGDFIGTDGELIGRHKGIIHYTIGQRKGLGIASSEPYYVCRICPENNTVVLGRHGDLMSTSALVKDVNWICGTEPVGPVRCSVKIRYRHKEQPAVITPVSAGELAACTADAQPGQYYDSADATGYAVRVEFDEPQRAITPGQAAVFYDGDIVLGGGVIV